MAEISVRARPIKTAFGRSLLDDAFKDRIGDHPLAFSYSDLLPGWWIFYGASGTSILCSGPASTTPFGRETFRRLTGTDPMPEEEEADHAAL